MSGREVQARTAPAGQSIRVDAPPPTCPSCGAELVDYYGIKVCPSGQRRCRARVDRRG